MATCCPSTFAAPLGAAGLLESRPSLHLPHFDRAAHARSRLRGGCDTVAKPQGPAVGLPELDAALRHSVACDALFCDQLMCIKLNLLLKHFLCCGRSTGAGQPRGRCSACVRMMQLLKHHAQHCEDGSVGCPLGSMCAFIKAKTGVAAVRVPAAPVGAGAPAPAAAPVSPCASQRSVSKARIGSPTAVDAV